MRGSHESGDYETLCFLLFFPFYFFLLWFPLLRYYVYKYLSTYLPTYLVGGIKSRVGSGRVGGMGLRGKEVGAEKRRGRTY